MRRIGRGSYGEVWLARHTRLGTLRAVKIVRRDQFDDARPFQREFDGTRRYEPFSRGHPNLVAILHVGGTDDCFFYVMELADSVSSIQCSVFSGQCAVVDHPLAGSAVQTTSTSPRTESLTTDSLNTEYSPHTLRSELKRHGALPIDRCLEIGLGLASALAHLHGRGLVHRDVKPSNVIFVGGLAKLADIGLVAAVSESRSLVGTDGYIPPEGPGTPSADCYALGKLLYELSTGHDRTAWPEPPADLPTRPDRERLLELNAILHKACAAEAKERYRSAEEMQAELALLQCGKSVKHKRGRESLWSRAKQITVVGILAMGLWVAAWRITTAANSRTSHIQRESKGTASQEAWNLYQQGRFFSEQIDVRESRKAIAYFQRAIESDPKFARAYEALGSAYCHLGIFADGPVRDYFAQAEAHVRRALELDSSLAEAWSALGYIKTKFGWNLNEAERLLRHAVALSPNNLESLNRLAICLSDQGKPDEAIRLHQKILAVDPVSADFNRAYGKTLFEARRYDEAVAAYQKVIELHPNFEEGYRPLGAALAHIGRNDEAVAALLKALRLSGASESQIEPLHAAYRRGGIKAFWAKQAVRPADVGTNYFPALTAAMNCTRAGDHEGAIQWLQKLYEEPLEFARIKVWPMFDPLRSDPRFIELLRKTGLDK